MQELKENEKKMCINDFRFSLFFHLKQCRCATTTRTATVRHTGRLRSATRQVLEVVWTAGPLDWQVSQCV